MSFLAALYSFILFSMSPATRFKQCMFFFFYKCLAYKRWRSCPSKILIFDGAYLAEFPCDSADFLDFSDNRVCLKIEDVLETWDTARARCIYRHGADLVRVDNQSLVTLIRAFFNWARNEPAVKKQGQNCVKADYQTGAWSVSDCNETFFYICQKTSARNPGPPTMEVQLFQGFTHAYIGQTILLRCSVLLQNGGFEITATVPSKNTYLWQNGSGLLCDADTAFVKVGDRCFPKTIASLNLSLTPDLMSATFECCWHEMGGFSTCSQLQIHAKYLLQVPIMVLPTKSYNLVFNEKDLLSITCAAFVGTNGQLIWVLFTSSGIQEWKMGPDAKLLNNGSVEERASFSESAVIIEVTLDPDQGPFIASTFQIVVSSSLDGASLACRSHSLEDAALNTGHMTVISPTITDIYIVLAVLILGLLLLFAVTILFIFVIPAAGMQMFKAKKTLKDHNTNEEVSRRIINAIGPHVDPLTIVRQRKLKWCGHPTRSSGIAKTTMQGTVNGGRRRGRLKKRWDDNIRECTRFELRKTLRKAEDREEWKAVVRRSSADLDLWDR
ncbi:eukaryotic translation initiation factor 3 subunit f [Plakobranchus ocellatus]|uniref:Eukaryotic translation initiation factor 3 subunit f n=1 Tax=Plakobranchus ocellatus TaxID=259542 RepID=A0AAV4C3W4_9GAST|nr:eukaryotic translation initiation factor 3 subunit f [Plakobranchus ocellatus]